MRNVESVLSFEAADGLITTPWLHDSELRAHTYCDENLVLRFMRPDGDAFRLRFSQSLRPVLWSAGAMAPVVVANVWIREGEEVTRGADGIFATDENLRLIGCMRAYARQAEWILAFTVHMGDSFAILLNGPRTTDALTWTVCPRSDGRAESLE